MSMKVKRGLGLLVVALIAFLLLNVTVRVEDALTPGSYSWVGVSLTLIDGAVMVAALVAGLALLAWGLLRD